MSCPVQPVQEVPALPPSARARIRLPLRGRRRPWGPPAPGPFPTASISQTEVVLPLWTPPAGPIYMAGGVSADEGIRRGMYGALRRQRSGDAHGRPAKKGPDGPAPIRALRRNSSPLEEGRASAPSPSLSPPHLQQRHRRAARREAEVQGSLTRPGCPPPGDMRSSGTMGSTVAA